jgi:adenine-specific DNA-methyltransferase
MNNVGGMTATNYWPFSETGHTDEAKKTLLSIFGGKVTFDTPKPFRLVERILQIASDPDSLILDSFAGSGTTAHAVLNMNKADGGNRKFILIEMEDYADSITAERVKRVIDGYGEGKSAVEGTGGNFTFYDLGEPLLVGDCLNESVGTEKIREYVWYTETRQPFSPPTGGNPYYLGSSNDTGYYFYYEPQKITVLDYAFLSTIPSRMGETVIYADRCAISAGKLKQMNITFKKIPRDISRL